MPYLFNGKQFDNCNDQKDFIQRVWDQISVDELQELAKFMPNRIFEFIQKNEDIRTKY